MGHDRMTDRILCIIPARGGSKRFPRKNIALLAGKPLIAYTIETARRYGIFEKIVVSTEDKEIAELSKKYGIEILQRSSELASDTARVPEVCLDVIKKYEEKGKKFDIVCILLPTSPLRKSEHLSEALKKFRNSGADYLISTTNYRYSPFRALKENENCLLEPFFDKKYFTRDQLNPEVVVHNGSIIFMKTEKFKEDKDYYGKKIAGYYMPFEYSIDINEPVDLKIAEAILKSEEK